MNRFFSYTMPLLSVTAAASLSALAVTGDARAQGASQAVELEEVVVTGTSIRGIAPTGATVIGVDREQIEATAPRTTTDLLATIPQIAQFNTVPTGGTGFVSLVNLRPSLPTGTTLILIDGHRMVLSGTAAGRADVSAIPTAAIARVEVIADGASAIYGSDAVGGVINFITRRDFQGAETSVRYGSGDSYNSYDFSQSLGSSWSSGSFMLSGQYAGHSDLKTTDRDYWSDVGTTSPGLNTSCPVASIGASNPRCDQSRIGGNLQPVEKRLSLFGSVQQSFSDTVDGWADITYSRTNRTNKDVQPALPSTPFAAGNPFNSSGVNQTVFYRPVFEYGNELDRDVNQDLTQLNSGVNFKLSGDWAGKVFAAYGKSSFRLVSAGTNNVAYTRAMAATTTATAFDPFLHRTSAAVLAQILDGTEITKVDQNLAQVGTKFDGPVFTLPAGEVRAAAGAEWRRESQAGTRRVGSPNSLLTTGTGYLSVGTADLSRNIGSLFGEVFIPVVGESNQVPLVKSLSLNLAGRYDDYSDVGATTNPKIGIEWRLINSLRLFGSWSTAFQAPDLGNQTAGAVDTRVQPQFNGGPLAPPAAAYPPYAGTSGLVIAGGGRNVKPQTSTSFAYGFEIQPTAWEGFRASVSYYHIDFEDFITVPGPGLGLWTIPGVTAKFTILAPVVGGVVQPFTATSPQVTQFTNVLPIDGAILPTQISWIALLQRANLGRKVQSGIDFDLSQRMAFGSHTLTARFAGSIIRKNLSAGAPGTVLTDVLPTDNAYRSVTSLDYDNGGFSTGATYSHLSGRYSTVARTVRIRPFDIFNVRAAYDFGDAGTLQGLQISLNVENLFDKSPPVQLDAVGGHNATLNMLGRVVSVGLRKSW